MTAPLWTSADMAAATGGRVTAPFAATGVSIDTRTLQPGELFVALKDARDGHDFVEAAFAAGAAGALVSRQVGDGPQLIVDDVVPALERLGVAARERGGEAFRIAVTGSVGKTSVKEMIARIHRAAGRAHWSVKSFNNHWGVPLTLARMPAETRNAVFEIGMSTPGEIAPRSKLVAPNVAMITKIAPAHLEGVGSIEGVAREKSDIAAGLVMPGGAACLPLDDEWLPFLAERVRAQHPEAEIYVFGRAENAARMDLIAPVAGAALIEGCRTDGTTCVVELDVLRTGLDVVLRAVGEHWAVNAAAALLAAGLNRAIDLNDAAEALTGYGPPPGRGVAETLDLPGGGAAVLVDDAYNANPESMRAALAALAARPASRRLAVLGEMLEIGAGSAVEHAALAGPVEASGATIAFLAGEGMSPLAESLSGAVETRHAVKAGELLEEVKNVLKPGDAILLKGSNASGVNKLADQLRAWARSISETITGSRADSRGQGD